jgi:5S rRNA maturation endonuclease (ribonuclease M5)
MIRACQRRATFPWLETKLIDKRRKARQSFGSFLIDFVNDLNHLSDDGWCILVEGERDERALRKLGFKGAVAKVSAVARKGTASFGGRKKVVVLTDLDREGAVLASRFVKRLRHDGLRTSLAERGRLKAASKGVFLNIENLSRFGEPELLSQ